LDELEQRARVFSAEDKSTAGVLIGLDWNGAPNIERGYVRPEDDTGDKGSRAKASTAAPASNPAEPEQEGVSAALMESLTAKRTAGLRIELAQRPDIALAAVVHNFAVQHFSIGRRVSGSCIAITAQPQHLRSSLDKPDENSASIELDRMSADWLAELPNDPDALFLDRPVE
jgi:ParB family chromosome partitioning protein